MNLKSAELCLGAVPPELSLQLVGSRIPREDCTVHLGVPLDRNLRWFGHIDRLLQLVARLALVWTH